MTVYLQCGNIALSRCHGLVPSGGCRLGDAGELTAVDRHGCAGDVGRLLTAQPDGQSRDLLGPADATHGNGGGNLATYLLGLCGDPVVEHGTGGDDVDPN